MLVSFHILGDICACIMGTYRMDGFLLERTQESVQTRSYIFCFRPERDTVTLVSKV